MSTVGLRERKKQETRVAIARAALELALEHGPDRVTVEGIAAAAGVSPRTVFNYFGTKDEAILGIDPERRAELCAEIEGRPLGEAPVDALAAVLIEAVTHASHRGQLWRDRARLVQEHTQLRAAQAASQAAMEHDMAGSLARRVGLPVDHPYPNAVAAAGLAVLRVALERSTAETPAALGRDLRAAFDLLGNGLRPPQRSRR